MEASFSSLAIMLEMRSGVLPRQIEPVAFPLQRQLKLILLRLGCDFSA